MKIKADSKEGNSFTVESDSGATYHITYAGSGDADPEYVATWACDCPAGQHGRDCKHMKAFLASNLMDYGDPYYEDDDGKSEVPSEIEV